MTGVPVVEALVRARHRGVIVRLVADGKDNVSADRSGKARAALGALVNAGADVRTIRVYPIHHSKVLIADRQTVELGSFNYSDAAAHRNSENVLVNWGTRSWPRSTSSTSNATTSRLTGTCKHISHSKFSSRTTSIGLIGRRTEC